MIGASAWLKPATSSGVRSIQVLRVSALAAAMAASALIAVAELESFTRAAQQLGLAQPTVHRSATMLEHAAGVRLFERTAHGLIATRAARQLALAARLAFAEMDQATAELGALAGREVGRIVIGALPLSRSGFLPRALVEFRARHPTFPFEVIDGRYDELLTALRRGEIDLMLGALRLPAPTEDIHQDRLFDDSVVIVARPGHPVLADGPLDPARLAAYPWVLPRRPTPIRATLDAFMAGHPPRSIIETSSVITMREILRQSDHLGALSRQQAQTPAEAHALTILPVEVPNSRRPIGLTTRSLWEPTALQREFLAILHEVARTVA